ncbi:MAG: alpha/beta hydrolase [Chloroflexi bacterium]|nr:alpha/beta hydrolase [Chloroflexota bacterium]
MKTQSAATLFVALVALLLVSCSSPDAPTLAPATPTVNPSPTLVAPTTTVSPAPTVAPRPAQATPARLGQAQKDVTYCTAGGVALKMDIYPPKSLNGKPAPVVVYVHGGGWRSGDKDSGAGIRDLPELARRGYLVASINYRLAPEHKWPAQIQDVKCAIRYLRANAATYNLDPNRIGAIGGSAGGHLVAMLGVTDKSAGFDVGEYLDQSSRVQAVVDLFGPSDLTASGFIQSQAKLGKEVFGVTSPRDPILAQASPVTYITKDDPPFLILQGDQDTTVPPAQSQELYDRLQAAGVPATLVMVKNAGHSFAPVGGAISPSLADLAKMTADFFDKHLKSQ